MLLVWSFPLCLLQDSRLSSSSSSAHTGVPPPLILLALSQCPNLPSCVLSTLFDSQAFTFAGQLKSNIKAKAQAYSTLLDSGCQGGEHAACFTELRRNFMNTRPTKLKNLILLVKHWYRQVRGLAPGT